MYAARSEDDTLEYHQYPIKLTILTDFYEGFKAGRKGFMNAPSYAGEQSYGLENQLKERWRQRRDALQPVPVEDKVCDEVIERLHQPTPPAPVVQTRTPENVKLSLCVVEVAATCE